VASLKEHINPSNLPQHIAVIMDGNGRWANRKGAARIFGHRNAVQSVKEITEGCGELGIKYLTLYAFSTENWSRPKEEIDGLMELLVNTLRKELDSLLKNKVRLRLIGELDMLPLVCQESLQHAVEATKNNEGLTLQLALSYSGRRELIAMTKRIAEKVEKGILKPEQIDEVIIEENLETNGVPDPELLIRTSGEMRISNFLLWQMAYTEFYFTSKLWPDFRKEDLYEAICDYQKRERRFGKVLTPIE
jgi:undecaprenyl diphosphate synthase